MNVRWSAVPGMLFRLLTVLVSLVLLGFIIAWLSGAFTRKIAPHHLADEPPRLAEGQETYQVHVEEKEYVEEALGTLKAASRTEVSAKVLATIDSIPVNAGDEVEAGSLLVQLSSEEFDARVRRAEEEVRAAEATRLQAEADVKRAEGLLAGNAIPRSNFEEYTTRLKVALAQEASARQALSEAEIIRSYATIRAPKSGRIVDRLAEPGDTAQPGQSLLVIYDAASLRLEAPVPEGLAVQLRVGQTLKVHLDALRRDADARIDEIVPQADAPSRSFLVKAVLSSSEGLYEGMFGRLLVPAGRRPHLCLATAAVRTIGQLEFVDVVQPDQTLQRRLIKTGRLGMPGRVEVISGLAAGEIVALQPGDGAAADPPQS